GCGPPSGPSTASGNYASYMLDVMRDVDYRFATIRARRERVIAGFSAGAYRATNIALTTSECSQICRRGRATTSRPERCAGPQLRRSVPTAARWITLGDLDVRSRPI